MFGILYLMQSTTQNLVSMSEPMFARALVGVSPQIEGELGFQTGDLITVKEAVDDDWFLGECHNKVGLVSIICIEFLSAASDNELISDNSYAYEYSSNRNTHTGSSVSPPVDSFISACTSLEISPNYSGRNNIFSHTCLDVLASDVCQRSTHQPVPYGKTLSAFSGEMPNKLSFVANEMVELIEHIDVEWVKGKVNEKTGLLPARHVQIYVDCPWTNNVCGTEKLAEMNGVDDSNDTLSIVTSCGTSSMSIYKISTVQNSVLLKKVVEPSNSLGANDLPPLIKPPAPSVFSKPNDKLNAGRTFAVVLHSFQRVMDGDLTVSEGDTLEILRTVYGDWVEVRDRTSCVGLVPCNHVRILSHVSEYGADECSGKIVGNVSSTSKRDILSLNQSVDPCGFVNGLLDFNECVAVDDIHQSESAQRRSCVESVLRRTSQNFRLTSEIINYSSCFCTATSSIPMFSSSFSTPLSSVKMSSETKKRNVFSEIDRNLPLDDLVLCELRKARCEGKETFSTISSSKSFVESGLTFQTLSGCVFTSTCCAHDRKYKASVSCAIGQSVRLAVPKFASCVGSARSTQRDNVAVVDPENCVSVAVNSVTSNIMSDSFSTTSSFVNEAYEHVAANMGCLVSAEVFSQDDPVTSPAEMSISSGSRGRSFNYIKVTPPRPPPWMASACHETSNHSPCMTISTMQTLFDTCSSSGLSLHATTSQNQLVLPRRHPPRLKSFGDLGIMASDNQSGECLNVFISIRCC